MTSIAGRDRGLRRASALLAAAIALHAGAARADDGPSRAHGPRGRVARAERLRRRGLEHFVRRDYQLAADELMAAYRLDKREDTLFSWAEAVRATGDCPLATRIYQRLLDKTSDLELVRQAEFGITSCERAEAIPGGGTTPDPAPAANPTRPAAPEIERVIQASEPAAPAPPVTPAAPAAPTLDHATSYLVIAGGAVTAVAGLAVYSSAADGTGMPGATHDQTTAARSSGDWQRLIGASIGVIGCGVAVFGVVRYRRDAPRAEPAIALGPYVSTTGAGIALGGRY